METDREDFGSQPLRGGMGAAAQQKRCRTAKAEQQHQRAQRQTAGVAVPGINRRGKIVVHRVAFLFFGKEK